MRSPRHSSAHEYCRKCRKCPACRTSQTGWCRFHRVPGRNACHRITKTHCEKKDRGWEIQPDRPRELRLATAESSCLSAPTAEFVKLVAEAAQAQQSSRAA